MLNAAGGSGRSLLVTAYCRLLRKTVQLDRRFAALGGSQDCEELSRKLVRTAHSQNHPRFASSEPAVAREVAVALPPGGPPQMLARTRSAFAAARAAAAAGEPQNPAGQLAHVFACLRLCTKLSRILDTLETPQPRTAAVKYNVGQVVHHTKLDVVGVIYGYDEACRMSEEWQEQNKVPVEMRTGVPFYHVACADGSFRYGAQPNLEVVSDPSDFLTQLRSEEDRTAQQVSLCRFVDRVLFRGMAGDRLVPNGDLWRRYPDHDGRTDTEGLTVQTKSERLKAHHQGGTPAAAPEQPRRAAEAFPAQGTHTWGGMWTGLLKGVRERVAAFFGGVEEAAVPHPQRRRRVAVRRRIQQQSAQTETQVSGPDTFQLSSASAQQQQADDETARTLTRTDTSETFQLRTPPVDPRLTPGKRQARNRPHSPKYRKPL
eukprot:Hpha_TRINITY_DN20561_c0_g1::TRINITY_DN20561_c0_g1_i1::g.30686::m.30686